MSNSRRGVFTATVVGLASVVAAIVIRKRAGHVHPHVGLYFEDGSMVSLPENSPQATALITTGRETIEAARSFAG